MKYGLILSCLSAAVVLGFMNVAATGPNKITNQEQEQHWVDSVFNAMSEDERLGQLFVARAHSNLGPDHVNAVKRIIKTYHVGGLCFFQGTPARQIQLINEYQALNNHVPMMISMDAEWGLGMRMPKTTISFPRQLALGAIQDNRLIYEMGAEVARQLKLVGAHVNFAPVADINNNAANPVINDRSFGENRYNVTVKSYMYMKGMQDNGVMASGKHFPGHGDTDVDSHYDLPVINHDRGRLDSIEFYPFRALVQHGIGSIMVAHLNMPAIAEEGRPTSLSNNTISKILREDMGYEGLVFTDALEMQAVTKKFKPGEVEVEALLAGNDILLLPIDIGASVRAIRAALDSGRLTWESLNVRVKKVLTAKYRLGLTDFAPLKTEQILGQLNAEPAEALKRKLIANSLTLVRGEDGIIPFFDMKADQLATVAVGASGKNTFQKRIDSYLPIDHHQTGKTLGPAQRQALIEKLKSKKSVIVSVHNMSKYASKDFGLTQGLKAFVNELNEHTRVILTLFGSPYSLKYFDDIANVLVAYEDSEEVQDITAQGLFGAFVISGRLPVTASAASRANMGVSTRKAYRLGYGLPAETGLNADTLREIDKLVQKAINSRATPGAVVLVAKDGKIVYHKAFGHHTYARRRKVQESDLFDLASITKIAASTVALMKLNHEGKVELDDPLQLYLPELDGTNKADIILRDLLAHEAGLRSWIPFYKNTVVGSRRRRRPSSKFYQSTPSEEFSIPVADRLFLNTGYRDSIWQQIHDSELPNLGQYRYSDLGFYYVAKLVESITGQTLDQYVSDHLYQPLDLSRTTFNPWKKYAKEEIIPTEVDRYFRKQPVHGYVHDMGAAMLGGVSGHAGLFSTANELAVIMQMILQGGQYGGHSFFSNEVIQEFTTRYAGSTRRGLGFDMYELSTSKDPNMAVAASTRTFGHLGFTGTSAWVDPKEKIVYIFLSNRTYPSMHNYRLNKLNTRYEIQSVIYRALEQKSVEDVL